LPKFYLKRWANEKNKVWVYKLYVPDGNQEPNPNLVHIDHVCSEIDLYSIGDDITLENWANTNIESYCAHVFKKIVKREQLSNDDVFYTKSFLALTMARHPVMKEPSITILNAFPKKSDSKNPLAQTVPLRMKANLIALDKLNLQILYIPDEIDAFYITSDSPFFIIWKLIKESVAGYEYNQPTFAHIWFPITPKHLACITEGDVSECYKEMSDIYRIQNINAQLTNCAQDILIANNKNIFEKYPNFIPCSKTKTTTSGVSPFSTNPT